MEQNSADYGPCDPETSLGANVNGTHLKCDPQTRRWVVNEDAHRYERERNGHLDRLAFALVSRVLTEQEMAEVESVGIGLYVRPMVAYMEADMKQRLNSALLQQFRLRQLAHSAGGDGQ